MDKKGKQLAKQGAILAAASLIVRLIGVLYRGPMANILGDEGMGYYSNAFNIYAYLLIISSYAMPTAISRIISGQLAFGKKREAHQLFKASLVLNILISAVFAAILYYIAAPYSSFIKVPGAERAIKSLAPSLVIFAIMSSFRGYFQGMHTMVPTAVSQIIEQIFNVVFSILLSFMLMKWGPEYGAAGGTIGTGIGAVSGLVFLIFIYYVYRSRLPQSVAGGRHLQAAEMAGYWKIILMTSIPMVVGTATFNISTIIDDMMFARALHFHNYGDKVIAALVGILNGKYTLIITVPIAIAAAIATASVPGISAAVALKNTEEIAAKVKMTLKGVLLITIPAAVGILVMAGPILNLIFPNMGQTEKVTTDILRIGAITVLFFSISTVSIGILQGLGHVNIPVKSAIKSILIKTAFNFIVFYAFNLNLYGAALANIVFSFVSAYFNLSAVVAKTHVRLNYKEIFLKPAGASAIMGGTAFLTYLIMDIFLPVNYWGNAVATFITIFIAMIVYFVLIIKLEIVSLEELKEMPFGGRLARIAQKIY